MIKKVLVISSSPRKNGNSELLCDEFIKGAVSAGHEVEKICLYDKKINFCTACYACQSGECPQKDDAPEIVQKMHDADVIVLATPVYFYTMCAQLKALIDRSVMSYPDITGKEFYFIMAMADDNTDNFRGTVEALRGFVECCENSIEKGMVCASGVYQKDEIVDTPFMLEAREMGKYI